MFVGLGKRYEDNYDPNEDVDDVLSRNFERTRTRRPEDAKASTILRTIRYSERVRSPHLAMLSVDVDGNLSEEKVGKKLSSLSLASCSRL